MFQYCHHHHLKWNGTSCTKDIHRYNQLFFPLSLCGQRLVVKSLCFSGYYYAISLPLPLFLSLFSSRIFYFTKQPVTWKLLMKKEYFVRKVKLSAFLRLSFQIQKQSNLPPHLEWSRGFWLELSITHKNKIMGRG